MNGEKPRQIAARLLRRHGHGSVWLETLLDQELAQSPLGPTDRALVQELTYGVVRWQATLDWLIARQTGSRPQKRLLRILLRLGLYQMFWLDRIPDHAAVNESVQLSRELGCGQQSGFVNALLRRCARERAELKEALQDLKNRDPALGYSHPDWLCARWEQRWGRERLRALLEWNNTPASVFVRVNTLKATPEKLAGRFKEDQVVFEPRCFDWVKPGLVFELKSHPPLVTLPSFQQGLFYVQDPSTLLPVRELNPQPNEAVLDLCAAPGGKSTFIAQLMRNQGTVLAVELDAMRRESIAQNCQ